jgi:hypothetical protein
MYRETLLCRGERVLRRDFPAEHFQRLLFASQTALSREKGRRKGLHFSGRD